MAKARGHSWRFRVQYRRHAFGWKSQPAIARLQEAVSEITLVAHVDPMTFLGGSAWEKAGRLAVAPDGDIVVSGHTSSGDFPVVRPTRGARGGASCPYEVVLARLDVTGRWLEYSTYLGVCSWGYEDPLVAVDVMGHALLAGRAGFGDFPVTAP